MFVRAACKALCQMFHHGCQKPIPISPTEAVTSKNDKESEKEDKAIQTLSYPDDLKENQMQEDSSLTSREIEETVHANDVNNNDNETNNNNSNNMSSMSEESGLESQTDV